MPDEPKNPWGSPEIVRLDAQLAFLGGLRGEVAKQMFDKGTYEVELGPRHETSITFRALPGENCWGDVVKTIDALLLHMRPLLKARKLGIIVTNLNEVHHSYAISIKNGPVVG